MKYFMVHVAQSNEHITLRHFAAGVFWGVGIYPTFMGHLKGEVINSFISYSCPSAGI
jgi:hypothetical protein